MITSLSLTKDTLTIKIPPTEQMVHQDKTYWINQFKRELMDRRLDLYGQHLYLIGDTGFLGMEFGMIIGKLLSHVIASVSVYDPTTEQFTTVITYDDS